MNGWTQLPGRWVEEALCGQTDPELFYPGKYELGTEAKRLCFTCPVQRQCLTWALDNREPHGIWGGYTASQRRTMRRDTTRKGA